LAPQQQEILVERLHLGDLAFQRQRCSHDRASYSLSPKEWKYHSSIVYKTADKPTRYQDPSRLLTASQCLHTQPYQHAEECHWNESGIAGGRAERFVSFGGMMLLLRSVRRFTVGRVVRGCGRIVFGATIWSVMHIRSPSSSVYLASS
jgi:hypothetical protein